jgi:hypothetical protein
MGVAIAWTSCDIGRREKPLLRISGAGVTLTQYYLFARILELSVSHT